MAFDWSEVLSDVTRSAVTSGQRVVIDEEDGRRRRSASSSISPMSLPSAKTGQFPQTLKKSSPFSGPAIGNLLQTPSAESQAGIIALFNAVRSGPGSSDDEERRRAGGGGGSPGPSPMGRNQGSQPTSQSLHARSELASRAAVAAGAQPVVIKVMSTISSRASAANLINYLGTRQADGKGEEAGKVDIAIHDQDGNAIQSADQRAEVLREWGEDFRQAYAVNAVVTLSLDLADDVEDGALADGLNVAFGSKPFLFHRNGREVVVFGVTDFPAKKLGAALSAREKGDGSVHAVEKAETDVASALSKAGIQATVRIKGAAASEKSGRYFLEKFLRSNPNVITSTGDRLEKAADVKKLAGEVWKNLSSDIRSVEPRNAFHVVFSARTGTDASVMIRAVRDFLSEQVPGHRWMTAHHPETRHVHVHAMIAERDDLGKPLRFTKPELFEWRERFAAKAREHGIAMVATRRSDLAATRSFSQAQAGAYERGRADPRYLKDPAVIQRVENKRGGAIDEATLANGNLALDQKWQSTVAALKAAAANAAIIAVADRFAAVAARRGMAVQPSVPKGFLLLKIDVAEMPDQSTAIAAVMAAIGVHKDAVVVEKNTIRVQAPMQASISRIERELAKQNDEFGPGTEMQRVMWDITERLMANGLRASVEIEAAGSSRDGKPTPWLATRFEMMSDRQPPNEAGQSVANALSGLLTSLQQRKEQTMPLSLEQFDERVARANKSMERLETVVDSSVEKQAVEEMRREIGALFAEQRQQIEFDQMRPIAASGGAASDASTAQSEGPRDTRSRQPNVDPAIVAQQQAIATGRAARTAREQSASEKAGEEGQRQRVLKDADQQRQNQNERDGSER